MWWSYAPGGGDSTSHRQGKQENKALGRRQKGKLGRQQAGSPRSGTHSPARAKLGLRDHARPSHSYKLGQAVWRIGPPLPPPSAPSQGASCGGWTSPPGKGSDVKRQEGRVGWKRREGGDEGGGRHAESRGVTLSLRPGSQPTQSSARGKDLLSLLLAQRHLVRLCQPLKPLLPQTLP